MGPSSYNKETGKVQYPPSPKKLYLNYNQTTLNLRVVLLGKAKGWVWGPHQQGEISCHNIGTYKSSYTLRSETLTWNI